MILKEHFYVGYSDINQALKLSNTALLRYFENIACMHGSLAGDGFTTSPAAWFLTGYHVKIHERPAYEDRLLCETWSSDMKGYTSAREFALYLPDGRLAATALSNWARIDRQTGRPVRLTEELAERYGTERGHSNFRDSWLKRLAEGESFSQKRSFFIDRNFIDPNRHMNNICYLELASLLLPEEQYVNEPSEFSIRYRKAVAYGETILGLYGENEDGCTVVLKSEDESDTRAVIRFYL